MWKLRPFRSQPLQNYIYISQSKLRTLLPQIPPATLATLARTLQVEVNLSILKAKFKSGGVDDQMRIAALELLRGHIMSNEAVGTIHDTGVTFVSDTVSVACLVGTERENSYGWHNAVPDGHVWFVGRDGDRGYIFNGSAHNIVGAAQGERLFLPGSFPLPVEVADLEANQQHAFLRLHQVCSHSPSMRAEILAVIHNIVTVKGETLLNGSPIYVSLA